MGPILVKLFEEEGKAGRKFISKIKERELFSNKEYEATSAELKKKIQEGEHFTMKKFFLSFSMK